MPRLFLVLPTMVELPAQALPVMVQEAVEALAQVGPVTLALIRPIMGEMAGAALEAMASASTTLTVVAAAAAVAMAAVQALAQEGVVVDLIMMEVPEVF